MPRNHTHWTSQDNGLHYESIDDTDNQGNPAGGAVTGLGVSIKWQAGPLQDNTPNGAFVEDIIEAVSNRLRFYQTASDGRFACPENDAALQFLNMAQQQLRLRTAKRRSQGVEGTHQPHSA